MKILNNVDLNQNQVKYALLHPTGTEPSDPKKGQVYFNTGSNKLLVWDGSNWVDCTSQGHAFETNTNNIKMNGTVSVGSLNTIPRADHVHPTDTSRASASDLTSHINNTSNPHSVTKTQVGLGNVTDDAQVKRDEMGAASGVATLGTDSKIPTSQIPDLSGTYLTTDLKGAANGLAELDSNSKVPLSQLPDAILGQLIYGGTVVPSTAVATLTANAKSKLGTTSSTITLVNSAGTKTSQTGWVANEGIYYIASASGTFAGLSFENGDWLISNGVEWTKIDTSDAVTSVNGKTGAVVLDAEDVGALPDDTDYVDLTTNQTIGGIKTFDSQTYLNGATISTGASLSFFNKLSIIGSDTSIVGQTEGSSTYLTLASRNNSGSSYITFNVGPSNALRGYQFGQGSFAPSGSLQTKANLGSTTMLWGTLYAEKLSDGTTTKTMTQVLSAPSKITASNTSLTPSGGVCTWTISNTLATEDVIVQVRDSSGNVVLPDIEITASTITISIVSASTITANTYKAVIMG